MCVGIQSNEENIHNNMVFLQFINYIYKILVKAFGLF